MTLPSFHPGLFAGLMLVVLAPFPALWAAGPPAAGDKAPDFALPALGGATVSLGGLSVKGPVVLVVLRGWPGYQCPICDRQVHDYIAATDQFAEAGAQLVFVYPGPAEDLKAHAEEFKTWKGREWPAAYHFLLDPDYRFTHAYGLRWDAPNETAYPSTFILDRSGTVRFAKVSRMHGDRTKPMDVLNELKKLAAGM